MSEKQGKAPRGVELKEFDLLDFEVEELKEADQEMTNLCIEVGFEVLKVFDMIRQKSHDQDEARGKFNKQVKRILKRLKLKDARVKPPVDYLNKKIIVIVPKKISLDQVKDELNKPLPEGKQIEEPKDEKK